jgi:hypothetical protein
MRRAAPDAGRRVRAGASAAARSRAHPDRERHRAQGPTTCPDSTWQRRHAESGSLPPTLRTWDRRYGIGPTDHTPDGTALLPPTTLPALDLMHRALIRGVTPADAAAHSPRRTAGPPSTPHDRHRPPTGPIPDAGPCTGGHSRPAPDTGNSNPQARGGANGSRARTGGTAFAPARCGRRARALGRLALALDADPLRGLLADSIAETGVQATWDDVIRPVLAAWRSAGSRPARASRSSTCSATA